MVHGSSISENGASVRARPLTSPLERESPALGIDAARRPVTAFPATGLDAELERLESEDVILRQIAMNNLIAMAKHGGSTERLVALMIERLEDTDMLFRGLAVEALSRSAKQVRNEVTNAFIRSLADPDPNVRIRATNALRPACVGPSHAIVVAALSGMLHDESPFVQEAAVDNLQYAIFGGASFEVRLELLSSEHKGIRAAAVDSFSEAVDNGDAVALDLMIGMLKDPTFQVRMAAIKVISSLLTNRDTKAVKEREALIKAEGKVDHEVPPAKAQGPIIDKTLTALMQALGDVDPDIRTTVIRALTCITAQLNKKVFKAILDLMGDEDDGTYSMSKTWISEVVTFTQERLRQEWAYTLVMDLLRNGSARTQLSAAWVVSKVVATGNLKYLKDLTPLLEHEHPLTRVAAVHALKEAVQNAVPSIMWSSSGGPTVPRCLDDPDRRVRLAAIEALSEAPEGSSTASQPLIKSLEDDDREVRNAAADALAKILARNDLKLKFMLVRIVAQNTAGQIAIGAGCQVGSKYMSLEVGYIGKRRRLDQEVRAAAIRAIRKMGVPDDIIRLGIKAMEVAIERHSLGYRYELTPTFFEENDLNPDGTPKNSNLLGTS